MEGMVNVREEVGGELQRVDRLELVQIRDLWKSMSWRAHTHLF